jgi:hypothetical protein
MESTVAVFGCIDMCVLPYMFRNVSRQDADGWVMYCVVLGVVRTQMSSGLVLFGPTNTVDVWYIRLC